MGQLVIDTSAVIAAVLNEPEKERLVELTDGEELIAPSSLHWEVGNAFSAMFKRGRLKLREAQRAIREYQKIPIRFVDVDLSEAMRFAEKENIYAYDAYFVVCAKKQRLALLSLDRLLMDVSKNNRVRLLEV